MAATAKIMAWLGLDAGNFKSGVDGAVKKTEEMAVSLRTMKKMTSMLFGAGMLSALIGELKELRKYQDESGVKIMSETDLQNLEAATEDIKRFKMEIIGGVGGGISKVMQGWKAFVAGIATGFDRQAMAESLENITGLKKKVEELTAKKKEYEKEEYKKTAPVAEQEKKAQNELNVLKSREAALQKMLEEGKKKGVLQQSEALKMEADLLEIQNARIQKNTELSDLTKKREDEQKKVRDDYNKKGLEIIKNLAEQEDLQNNIKRTEQEAADYTEAGMSVKTSAQVEQMENQRELTKLMQAHADAQAKLEREESTYMVDETDQQRALRIDKARLEVAQKVADVEKKNFEMRKEGIKQAEEKAKKENELKKKREEIIKERDQDVKDRLAGKDAGAKAIDISGGLQSIGGYFASRGAVQMAQKSRAEVVQDDIRKILARSEKALQKLAEEN